MMNHSPGLDMNALPRCALPFILASVKPHYSKEPRLAPRDERRTKRLP